MPVTLNDAVKYLAIAKHRWHILPNVKIGEHHYSVLYYVDPRYRSNSNLYPPLQMYAIRDNIAYPIVDGELVRQRTFECYFRSEPTIGCSRYSMRTVNKRPSAKYIALRETGRIRFAEAKAYINQDGHSHHVVPWVSFKDGGPQYCIIKIASRFYALKNSNGANIAYKVSNQGELQLNDKPLRQYRISIHDQPEMLQYTFLNVLAGQPHTLKFLRRSGIGAKLYIVIEKLLPCDVPYEELLDEPSQQDEQPPSPVSFSSTPRSHLPKALKFMLSHMTNVSMVKMNLIDRVTDRLEVLQVCTSSYRRERREQRIRVLKATLAFLRDRNEDRLAQFKEVLQANLNYQSCFGTSLEKRLVEEALELELIQPEPGVPARIAKYGF